MNLSRLIDALSLKVLTPLPSEDLEVTGGYCGDLLSHVLSSARPGVLWITIQHHVNVVAVAQVAGLSAVVMADNRQPDDATLTRAETHGIVLLGSEASAYDVCGRLHQILTESR